jgi:hypothetical protein
LKISGASKEDDIKGKRSCMHRKGGLNLKLETHIYNHEEYLESINLSYARDYILNQNKEYIFALKSNERK